MLMPRKPKFRKAQKGKNRGIATRGDRLTYGEYGIKALENFDFDLMLAGHVHGGQISLPFIGPLSVPVKNRHLRRGLHKIGQKWLYTNRGLGQIFQARLLSRPEIACLDLIPAE